ncbi:MAG: ABC transporter ATP-binding protein, partial [Anaerolineae bacterium]|nr:ABC transporter ATP-binding protein [Anaerolineae bacterium]
MSLIIETKDLRKRYGKFDAVNGLSLEVVTGSIYGFVGPNGAGKTTTMRMLTTLTRPTAGQAWVAGHSVTQEPRAVRRAIGYMPDEFGVYDDMRVWEYLDFFAACYDIPEANRKRLIDDLLELVDLTHRRDDMVDKLSRGMKQRLSLARTLAHDPQILILDEPASGLDPRARVEIRELLVELSRMGKTIFFSSHILADVAEICTHIGIIEGGKMVAQGSMEDMRAQLMPHREIIVTVRDNDVAEKVVSLVSGIAGVVNVAIMEQKGGRSRVRIDFTGDD